MCCGRDELDVLGAERHLLFVSDRGIGLPAYQNDKMIGPVGSGLPVPPGHKEHTKETGSAAWKTHYRRLSRIWNR